MAHRHATSVVQQLLNAGVDRAYDAALRPFMDKLKAFDEANKLVARLESIDPRNDDEEAAYNEALARRTELARELAELGNELAKFQLTV